LLGSCSKGTGAGAPGVDSGTAHGAVVARVGRVELREDDVRRAMARDPGVSPARFQAPSARRELIDGLVRFELLAQAAERAGFTKDPDAIHAMQQIAVTKLVNDALGAAGNPESITVADVEREYEARRDTEFTLPPAAQVRHIRIANATTAANVAAQARALAPADDAGFATLATRTSEDLATSNSGGALGFVDTNSRLPRAVIDAALALKTPGEVTGPVHTESGYEILRLVSRRAPVVSPLGSVEETIRQRLYRDRRAKALDALIAKLRIETPVEILDRE